MANELDRYALGDRSDLTYTTDSSLIRYLQKDHPGKDKESNFFPIPDSPFRLALHVYKSKEEVISLC